MKNFLSVLLILLFFHSVGSITHTTASLGLYAEISETDFTLTDHGRFFRTEFSFIGQSLWLNQPSSENQLQELTNIGNSYSLNQTIPITRDWTELYWNETYLSKLTVYAMETHNDFLYLLIYDDNNKINRWALVEIDPMTGIVKSDGDLPNLNNFMFDFVFVEDMIYIGTGSGGSVSYVYVLDQDTLTLLNSDPYDSGTVAGFAYDGTGIWTHHGSQVRRKATYEPGYHLRYSIDGELELRLSDDTNYYHGNGDYYAEEIQFQNDKIFAIYNEGIVVFDPSAATSTSELEISIITTLVTIVISSLIFKKKLSY